MYIQNYDEDEEDLTNTIISSSVWFLTMLLKRKRKHPSIRVNPYLRERHAKGRFEIAFYDMVSNEKVFEENFHMGPNTFHELFGLVEPKLNAVRNTRPFDGITPLEKFVACMEYLASGSIQRHVASVYRISKQHFGKILDDVCVALCEALHEYIPKLDSAKFVNTANEFYVKCSMPKCLGAIDGKLVSIKYPKNATSLFYNYEELHSVVVMAIADANYKFVYIDVGAYGSKDEPNVFGSTKLGKEILADKLPFPVDMAVGNENLPYFFVADDAFPLCKRILKPYSPRKSSKLNDEERIANYRISRARRCVENAFGVMCCKWLCLSRTMFCKPDRAQKIITACCYLQNYLLSENSQLYCPQKYTDFYDETGNFVAGEWRKHISPDALYYSSIHSTIGRQSNTGQIIRDKLKNYFISPSGSIPWQNKAAFLE